MWNIRVEFITGLRGDYLIVLSIDDVQFVRKMIRGTVEALGGTLLEASDGIEGLAVLEKNVGNVDLILLDWTMPKMDGFEFLSIVKSNNRYRPIPVIMITTENEKNKIIKAIQAGASNYLVKPFTEQELAKKIVDCLGLGYERLNKCLTGALKDIISVETALEIQEGIGDNEEKLIQQHHYFGQVLFLGPVNAVVFFTMNKETATAIVGKSPTELTNKELINGITKMAGKFATRAVALLAEADALLNITSPYVFAGIVEESRHMFHKKKFNTLSKKYRAGDIEVTLYIYPF